jgi:PIN domain nuclease of toxin-antitoxin system
MRFLLDTHLLLWTVGRSERLSAAARELFSDLNNRLFFSSASIWEVAIKHERGRSDFSVDPRLLRRTLLGNGYDELPVTGEHAVAVGELPPLHKDPFDRILIAQSVIEGITLLTVDRLVARYPGPIQRI